MRPVVNLQRYASSMGYVFAEILLINGEDLLAWKRKKIDEQIVKKAKVTMLVDSGAAMLAINENICAQLGLEPLEQRPAQMADGSVVMLDVVGPIELRFANRRSNVDAIVLLGNAQPLLGVIPMEDMDVLIDPKEQKLIVNPEHPIKPLVMLK